MMNLKRIYIGTLILVILSFTHTCSYSQKSNVGAWYMYYGNQAINKKWNWHNEVQYRAYDAASDMQQLLLRTGIGYNLTPANNNLLLGYAYILTKNYTSSGSTIHVPEHRLFQQYLTKQQISSRVLLTHRYRLEERFFTNKQLVRFRYFLMANVAITKKSLLPNTLYASCYNEFFLQANNPTFDRNRLYGAVGYILTKYIRVEVGYMNQRLQKSGRNQVQFAVFNSLPL